MEAIRGAIRPAAGFTLVELMLVVAIIAVIASLALPRMTAARAASQESSAIAMLRSLSSAQAQLLSSNAIDTDANGAGEYGSFGELSGAQPLRVSAGGAPAAGTPGVDELVPPAMSTQFSQVDANSVVAHSGYVFKIYLPGAGLAPLGVPENPGGGFPAGPFPDSINGQYFWCAYAWPFDAGRTGRRCFFMSEQSEVLSSTNRGAGGAPVYSGVAAAGHAGFDAAYTATDMSSAVAVNAVGADGNFWSVVQ